MHVLHDGGSGREARVQPKGVRHMDESSEPHMAEINGYKQLLCQSDYKALKHADGAMSDEEYAPIKAKRAEWRSRINAAEAELAAEGE